MPGYIPSSAVNQILSGSYEETIQSLQDLVSEEYELFSANGPDDISVVSTFPSSVIVTTSEGSFYRANYGRDGNEIKIQKVESIDVPVLKTKAEQKEYLSETAMNAISAFLSGDFETARSQVRDLVKSGNLLKDEDPLEEARMGLNELFSPERPWRKTYSESSKVIHKVLWGASGATFRYSPKTKYEEAIKDGNIFSMYEDVLESLNEVSEKLKTIWSWVEESIGGYDAKGFKDSNVSSVIEGFEEFVKDYLEELRSVCKLAESAASDEDKEHVAAMALVHDTIAKNYASLEVGARLIKRVASELSNV